MGLVNITDIQNLDSATPELFNSRYGKLADVINGNIDSANLASDAVTTPKIVAGAVTTGKLADGAATPAKWTNPYLFRVNRAAAWSTFGSGGGLIPFDTKVYDLSNNFSTTTHLFTAPVDGYYHFSGAFQESNPGSGTVLILALSNNDGTIERCRFSEVIAQANTGNLTLSGSADVYLAAGDACGLWERSSVGSGGIEAAVTWFSGHLIRQV